MRLIEHGPDGGQWLWSMTRPIPASHSAAAPVREDRREAALALVAQLAGVPEMVRDRGHLSA